MSVPLRLASLVLEKYGPYENRTLTFRADTALHVVFGRNEAGKSVTLRALSDLFCGFPARIDAEDGRVARFRSAELRVGATLLRADGASITFRRRAGRANTLFGATDNDKCDEAALRAFAGAPDRKEFESEFGLTAEALRSGGQALLAAGGRLAETLAAGSAALSALNRIRARLQEEADAIYTTSGRARPLNLAIDRYQTANKEFRAAIVTGDALRRAREALDQAQARGEVVKGRLGEIERRRALLLRAQRTCEKLRLRAERIAALESFSDLPAVDAATLREWSEACARDAELAAEIAQAQELARAIEAEAAALKLAPDLIARARDIEKLREMLGAADSSQRDLPKREEAARSGLEKLERAAQALGLAGAAELVARMPADLALTRARDLQRKLAGLETRRESAAARLEKAQATRRALEASAPQRPEDPAPRLRALEAFADLPAAATRLRAEAATIEENAQKLEREAARLPLPLALETLLRLPLPDSAAIEAQARRSNELAEEGRVLARDAETNARRISELEASLRDLERDGEVASPDAMRAARRRRDEDVDALERGPDVERAARFAGLRNAISDADRQADLLLGGADRAARRQQIADALATTRDEGARIAQRHGAHADALRAFDADWRALWAASGLTPLEPSIMLAWRIKVASIVEQHESASSARVAFASGKAAFTEKAERLRLFAQDAGVEPGRGEPAADLYARVRAALDLAQKAWTESREREGALQRAGAEIEEAAQDITNLDAARAALAPDWTQALGVLALSSDARLAEAEEALRLWAQAITDHLQHQDDEHRVAAIRADIAAFEARAGELGGVFCPDMAGETPRRIVEALAQRLQDARSAGENMERCAARQEAAAREIAARTESRAAVRKILAAAAAVLGVPPEAAASALARLTERRNLEDEIAALGAEVTAMGDGQSPEALAAEQRDLDFDALAAELVSLETERHSVVGDLESAAVEVNAARKALEELEAGRDAPGRALERDEAAAQILEVGRNWLLRAGAARLAVIAMEQHRRRNQDPVIAEAGRLFARATGGAYAGVAVDLDEAGQPVLKGARAAGERVAVEAMSEGTRDQLFLALRLALLAQRTGDPLPFVGDDLLASFDDDRTGHTLEMMAEFARGRQVVLFTHHRSVADAARARLGAAADVIELGV